jgi:hypothetical protein
MVANWLLSWAGRQAAAGPQQWSWQQLQQCPLGLQAAAAAATAAQQLNAVLVAPGAQQMTRQQM